MSEGGLKKIAESFIRDAFLVNVDCTLIWCKHCRHGYNYNSKEAMGRTPVQDYIIHEENCGVMDAHKILNKL